MEEKKQRTKNLMKFLISYDACFSTGTLGYAIGILFDFVRGDVQVGYAGFGATALGFRYEIVHSNKTIRLCRILWTIKKNNKFSF